jgi:splicing factor 3B subunit 4
MSGFLPPSLSSLYERNQEATVYIGNLDLRVTEDILWELFVQCGPVFNVHIPRDKITGEHQGFSFVEFRTEEDADYAIKIMHMIKLYGKAIKVNKASQDKRTQEVGANIFVGNVSEEVDEKQLKDIFTAFGVVLSTKIMRDPETGSSKRYGFVSFDNFDSSDEAIKKLNGQYISGKPIEVTYAFKKDTKGEKHGSVAERILAANRPINLIGASETPLSTIPSMLNPSFNMNTSQGNPTPPITPPIPQGVAVGSIPLVGVSKLPMMPHFNLPMQMMPPQMPPVNFSGIRPPMMPPSFNK